MSYGRFFAPYQLEDLFSGTQLPSAVKNNSAAFWYWFRCLYQRVCSIIEFNLPDNWQRATDYFEAVLFVKGFVPVVKTIDYGTIFTHGDVMGFDVFYQPTNIVAGNPKLKQSTWKIGKNCEVIKLSPDFHGVTDLISYYAEKLATIDGAVNMNIVNSKFGYFMAAKNKSAAKAIRTGFDLMNRGEPLVVLDQSVVEGLSTDEPFEFIDRAGIKNSYIVSDLLQDARSLLNAFDNEIGIPTLGVGEKKERVSVSEATAKNADTTARVSLWDETLARSVKKVNELFGLNITYNFKFLDKIELMENEKAYIDGEEDIKRWVMQSQR